MTARKLVYVALFAALTAAGAFLRLPLGMVSVTAQFLVTAMAGALLGAKWGAVSQGVYVALGLLGLPIFTMGGGFGYVLQPTFGFVLALIPAAWVIGRVTGEHTTPRRMVVACLAGLGVVYAIGLPYMALICNGYLHQNLPFFRLMMVGCVPFLPFDAVKVLLAAIVCPVLQRRLRSILP